MDLEKIGIYISNKRKEKRLTQTELASKLNVAVIQVRRLETGKKLPDILVIEQICKILDISITEFFKAISLDDSQKTISNELLLDTIKFTNKTSNNKYVSVINKFLVTTFLLVTIIFGYLNFKMMYYQNKTYRTDNELKEYKEIIDSIKSKFELIEDNKDKFTEDYYNKIIILKDKYESFLNDEKINKLLINKNEYKLSEIVELTDLNFQYDALYNMEENKTIEIDIYKIIIEKDSKYIDNLMKYNLYMNFIDQQQNICLSEASVSKSHYSSIRNNLASSAQYMYLFKVQSLNMVLDDIIKVGELDEL